MSEEHLRCSECGATWESAGAAVEIWRTGECLACGAAVDRADGPPEGEPPDPDGPGG